MNKAQTSPPPALLMDGSAVWLAAALGFALLVMLFPLPQPGMISNQPWRVELVTSLVLCACFATAFFRDRGSIGRIFSFGHPFVKWIFWGLVAFTIWGFFSALWASSPASVWHHTLVWSQYILFLVFALEQARSSANLKFITTIFTGLAGFIGILTLIDYALLPDFDALEGVLRGRYSRYAELLVAILPLVWITAVYLKRRSAKVLITIAGCLGWIAVMLSLSKGAFLAGIAGFSIAFVGAIVFCPKYFRKHLALLFVIWVALTVAVQTTFTLFSPIPATVDYISGKHDVTRETSTARIYMWRVGRQMASDHWLFGVGADNFGISFNNARARDRVAHPDDPKDEVNSDYLVERAHNEPLQIAAELGVIGISLLLACSIMIAVWFVRFAVANRSRLSPMLLASIGGMLAFAASSMVSSFSLRLVQNGIAFFLVLAVAIREMSKGKHRSPVRVLTGSHRSWVPVTLSILLVGMVATFSLKAAAEYSVGIADRETDTPTALELYRRASIIDPDYASAYLRSSGRSYSDKDYVTAAAGLRRAIDEGMGVVITYSALAACQERLGDTSAASGTFGEALSVFPRSVFLRVRYAEFLHKSGLDEQGDAQFMIANGLDQRQSLGWQHIMRNGSISAFYASQSDPNIAAPVELIPRVAVYEYLDDSPVPPAS